MLGVGVGEEESWARGRSLLKAITPGSRLFPLTEQVKRDIGWPWDLWVCVESWHSSCGYGSSLRTAFILWAPEGPPGLCPKTTKGQGAAETDSGGECL